MRTALKKGYGKTAIGVVIVAIILFPVYWMVLTSLRTDAEVARTPPQLLPTGIDFSAYSDVLSNPTVTNAIVDSLVLAVGTMLLTLLLAVPASYALARKRVRGVTWVLLLLLVTQLLPGIAVATPLFILFRQLALLNTYLGLMLAIATLTVPFAILILRPFFLRIPSELEAAALVDGCRPLGAFIRVILPISRPGIVTVGVLSFLLAWGEFLFVLSLTTTNDIQPLTIALTTFSSAEGTEWNRVMAVATIVAIPIALVFVGLQRYVVGGLTLGGIKE
jgi:multiple sugar transport system permease protein